MKIYRIQSSDGRGPWRPGFSSKWMDEDISESREKKLKPWHVEFGVAILAAMQADVIGGKVVGCGCTSEDQLREWFTQSEYNRLIALGYSAVKLEASRILAESKIQCVFVREMPLARQVEPFNLYPAKSL